MTLKKLCVVTGTRAEYGLLKYLMRAISDSEHFQLQVVVAAAHLLPQLGHTVDELLADGFVPDAHVDMLLASNSSVAVAKSTALGLLGFADAFDRLKPDMVFILGDRFEALAAAQAAYLQRIPVAHLHGGELTLGALDDAIRHAITKLSAVHFVAYEDYARRVRQLGEENWRIRVVGPMVADALLHMTWLSREQLAADIGLNEHQDWVLLTYHPETLGCVDDVEVCEVIYQSLCQQYADAQWIWTYPNVDTGGERVLRWLLAKAQQDDRIKAVASLGQQRYLSMIKASVAVVGNSSSGLLEAPWLGVPTVNIGTRQAGRLSAASVFDCCATTEAVVAAMQAAGDYHLDHQGVVPSVVSAPSEQILAFCHRLDWHTLLPKHFIDLTC